MTYIPCWQRADSPTATLSERDAYAYWKTHALEDDIRFYLATQHDLTVAQQADLWAALDVVTTQPKRAHKAAAKVVRDVMTAVGVARGYVGPQEQQRMLGQAMAHAIDCASEAA